jgi:hypothetical protein
MPNSNCGCEGNKEEPLSVSHAKVGANSKGIYRQVPSVAAPSMVSIEYFNALRGMFTPEVLGRAIQSGIHYWIQDEEAAALLQAGIGALSLRNVQSLEGAIKPTVVAVGSLHWPQNFMPQQVPQVLQGCGTPCSGEFGSYVFVWEPQGTQVNVSAACVGEQPDLSELTEWCDHDSPDCFCNTNNVTCNPKLVRRLTKAEAAAKFGLPAPATPGNYAVIRCYCVASGTCKMRTRPFDPYGGPSDAG